MQKVPYQIQCWLVYFFPSRFFQSSTVRQTGNRGKSSFFSSLKYSGNTAAVRLHVKGNYEEKNFPAPQLLHTFKRASYLNALHTLKLCKNSGDR